MAFHRMSPIRWTIGRCVHHWTPWSNQWIKVGQNPWVYLKRNNRNNKSSSSSSSNNNKLVLFVLNLTLPHSHPLNSYQRRIIRRIRRPRRHHRQRPGGDRKTVNEPRRGWKRRRRDRRRRWICTKFSSRNPRRQVQPRHGVHFNSTGNRMILSFRAQQIAWRYRVRDFTRTKLEEVIITRSRIHLIVGPRRPRRRAPIKRSKHLCTSILPRTVQWTVVSKWHPVQVGDHFWSLIWVVFSFACVAPKSESYDQLSSHSPHRLGVPSHSSPAPISSSTIHKSLPDLAFITQYSKEIPRSRTTSPLPPPSNSSVAPSPASQLAQQKQDAERPRTLKSIKRYKNSKHSTEPLGVFYSPQLRKTFAAVPVSAVITGSNDGTTMRKMKLPPSSQTAAQQASNLKSCLKYGSRANSCDIQAMLEDRGSPVAALTIPEPVPNQVSWVLFSERYLFASPGQTNHLFRILPPRARSGVAQKQTLHRSVPSSSDHRVRRRLALRTIWMLIFCRTSLESITPITI